MKALQRLRELMSGTVLSITEDGYQAAREVWNAAVPHRPAIIACCADAADVESAVRVAVEHGLPLSVKAGGTTGRAARSVTADWCSTSPGCGR